MQRNVLLFGQVSNLLSGLGCALHGQFLRERRKAEDGVQMFLADVQHLSNTKPALLMPFLAAVVKKTYIRVALDGSFSANCTGLTTVSHKGSICAVFHRKTEIPEGSL